MQILVIGMHRSGTSAAARLLNMLGAYFAPEGISTGANRENPKGFWERRDVRDLNDSVLRSIGADWDRLSRFSLDKVPRQILFRFETEARRIILELDSRRPWFIKEPRLCLLAPLWLPLLEFPISVIVHRAPMDVAHSLQVRNGFPINYGLALWEYYNLSALNDTRGQRRLHLDYNDLLLDPLAAVRRLKTGLEKFGVRNLGEPTDAEILAFVDPSLNRSKGLPTDALSAEQRALDISLREGQALHRSTPIPVSASLRRSLAEGEGWSGAQSKISELEQEGAQLEAKLARTESLLATTKADLAQIRTISAENSKNHAKLILRREGQIGELRHLAATSEATIRQSSVELGDLRRSLTERERESNERAHHLADLQEQLNSRARENAALKKGISELRHLAATNEATIRQSSAELGDLRRSLTERERESNERAHHLADLQEQLNSRARENAALKKGQRLLEKMFARLTGSRSFHFLAHTLSRLGLVSRTPREAAKAIEAQFAKMRTELEERSKSPARVVSEGGARSDSKARFLPIATAGHATLTTPSETDTNKTGLSIDVVICIHNARNDAYRCLTSVLTHRTREVRKIVLVNDGSDEPTSAYLRHFSETSPVPTTLVENPLPRGYTLAANQGLSLTSSDYVILLNSDTIVTPGWLSRLLTCGESEPSIGLIGPISNAASWQSVPERFARNGDWEVNKLAEELLPRIANSYSLLHDPQYPRVQILNGFCLAIKRRVLDAVGQFDEVAFPNGYGEENDYCLRAGRAGFTLAVADDCYVFHAKSKSYSHETRRQLSAHSSKILREKYGSALREATDSLRDSAGLERARTAFSWIREGNPISLLFLMPFRGFGGGVSSIVQEAAGLRELGLAVQIAIRSEDEDFYFNRFPTIPRRLFFAFADKEELLARAASFEMVVATLFTSVRLLSDLLARHPQITPFYYIQDYEPNFYPTTHALHKEASESYSLIPDIHCFAKTRWLCRVIAEKHGVKVHKVEPSIDRSIFFPGQDRTDHRPAVVCAMVRPHTPYRAPEFTLEILRQIKQRYADRVEIRVFGVKETDPFLTAKKRDFDYKVLGILDREQVATLLREAFLFIDASSYQAFGRSGLEAMACGCATILPAEGGTDEYAVDGANTFLTAHRDLETILSRASQYFEDPSLHRSIVAQGIRTAERYSIEEASISELKFFQSFRRPIQDNPDDPSPTLERDSVLISGEPPRPLSIRPSTYKFRITILSSTTNIHGGTKRLLTIAQKLHQRGHQVTFVRHHRGRELDWFHLDPPLREVLFDARSSLAEVERMLPDADILLTYGNNRSANLLDGLSRRKGLKYLLFMHMGVHDRALDEINAALPNFSRLSTTTWLADELKRCGSSATPIGFGIHSDQFFPVNLPRDFRVGTLIYKDHWKRSSDVFEAAKLIRKRFPLTKLVAFGQMKNPPLDFEGEYHYDPDQAALRRIYSSCAAWVTASLWEGIGMCSVEAMLCKTPLVTTDTGGSRDFCNGRNSLLVDKQSPSSIAAAVNRLFLLPDHARKIADQAYTDIHKWTWDRCIDRLEEIFLLQATSENPTVVSQRRCELTVGVVIPHTAAGTRPWLADVCANIGTDYEVIVIDNSNSSETNATLREVHDLDSGRFRYVRNASPQTFGYSYNQIVTNSCGRYICMLPFLTEVTSNWDLPLVDSLRGGFSLALANPREPASEAKFKMTDFGSSSAPAFPPTLLFVSGLVADLGFFGEALDSELLAIDSIVEKARRSGYRCALKNYRDGSFGLPEPKEPLLEISLVTPGPDSQGLNIKSSNLIGTGRVAFLYNAKYSSSTRKRTFEIVRSLQRYIDVIAVYLPSATPDLYKRYDNFVLQRIGGLNETLGQDLLAATLSTIEKYRSEGKRFFYDIDDFILNAQDGVPKRLIAACDGVIASTPHLERLLSDINPTTLCLRNGIDYERFLAATPAGWDKDCFHIICASLGAVGHKSLAHIAEKVRGVHPEITLHLFCNVAYCQEQSGLVIHPSVPLDELFGCLKSSDLIVNFDLPDERYSEQLEAQYRIGPDQISDFVNSKSGLKYYNAGAAAKPFISTPRPSCYAKLIQHGSNGFLANTTDEFVDIILRLYDDPDLCNRIGRTAFEDVLANHTLDQTVFDYLDAFTLNAPNHLRACTQGERFTDVESALPSG